MPQPRRYMADRIVTGRGWIAAAVAGTVMAAAAPAAAVPLAASPYMPGGVGGIVRVQDARELPPAQRAALVRAIQEQLQQQGFSPGSADGVYGARTRQAIQSYQRQARLRVDGLPTKELLDHLNFGARAEPPAAAAPRTASRTPPAPQGGRGLVLDVQRELSVRGYYTSSLDGVAGPRTQSAVRAFQRDAGFPVTGVIDERLLAELRVVDTKIRADGRR